MATKLQRLSAKHPDIIFVSDQMFEKFATAEEVRQMIARKYKEEICYHAVLNYKNNYWKVYKQQVTEKKTAMKSIADLVGEDGLTAGANALLWQALQKMTIPQLMAFKRSMNDADKVKLLKKQFALYNKEHRQKLKERMKAGDGEVQVDPAEDYARAQRVVQQVKEIFGIGMTDMEPMPAKPVVDERSEQAESRRQET